MHPPWAADSHLDYINLALEILFAIANTSKPADDVTLSIHKKLCFPRQLKERSSYAMPQRSQDFSAIGMPWFLPDLIQACNDE